MKEVLKNELRELFDSFDNTESVYEKGYIASVFDYLADTEKNYDIVQMNQEIAFKLCFFDNEYNKYLSLRKKRINSFMKNNRIFFNYNIEKQQERKAYPEEYLKPLSGDTITNIIESFLKNIDSDLWNFYLKMVNEGRILNGFNNITLSTSLTKPNSIILIEKLQDLNDIMIFIHELGHAYYSYINNSKITDNSDISNELKDEIPAKVLEIKFIEYIQNNVNYEDSFVLRNRFDTYTSECDEKRGNFEYLKYLIAANLAYNIKDLDFNLTDYYKHLYESSIFDIVSEMNNEVKLGKAL